MSETIGADTDGLNSPALRQASEEIGDTVKNYQAAIDSIGPIVAHHRNSDLDRNVRQLLENSPNAVNGLLSMIQQLSKGDASVVTDMASFFADSEEDNISAASSDTNTGTGTGTGPHHI